MQPTLMERLAKPGKTARTESDVQSDVRNLLLRPEFQLGQEMPFLEQPMGDGSRRRIDVAMGATVIEVKKNLDDSSAIGEYEEQLAGYVRTRRQENQSRYNGILTDGRLWYLYEEDPANGAFDRVSTFTLSSPDKGRALIEWLQAVLATHDGIKPTERTIEAYLGSASPAYAADRAYLTALYDTVSADPTVALKRELWARLLRSSLGTSFTDDKALFVDHTMLVIEAMAIGHAVMGLSLLDVADDTAAFVSGDQFEDAGIHNVMEAGFFDWVMAAGESGEQFVRRLVQRISTFDWSKTEHDVLKVLYESIISAQTRKGLGEYYTPDWLAGGIVEKALTEPLTQRALDPSCGSGTFIYALVKRILAAADEAGWGNAATLAHVQDHVFGLDIHPVSIILARITYLLALGDRIRDERGDIWVPIHLGDSIQWHQPSSHDTDVIRISTDGEDLTLGSHGQGGLFDVGRVLAFPLASIDDAGTFDRLVTDLTDLARTHTDASKRIPSCGPVLRKYGIPDGEDSDTLKETFRLLCNLNAEGRDTIWGFFVRNQVRPLWLSMQARQVDVLVGNPPWVAYRHMTASMQEQFRRFSEERDIWHGKKLATQQDLVGLFIVRSVEKYLRVGGRFAFVTPLAVLSRQQYEGFRTGRWGPYLRGDMTELWDLDGVRPKGGLFPVPAAVVFGTGEQMRRGAGAVEPHHGMTGTKLVVTGLRDRSGWEATKPALAFTPETNGALTAGSQDGGSEYRESAVNGATIYPRQLFFAREKGATNSKLGMSSGRVAVESMRTAQEKLPWKSVPSIEAVVEQRYLFDVHLGATIAPFRLLQPWRAVLPLDRSGLMTHHQVASGAKGLRDWWDRASVVWETNRAKGSKMSLRERLNFQGGIARQLNPPAHRVLYSKSGTKLAAARIEDPKAIIENGLYWVPCRSRREAQYLAAVLNAPLTTNQVSAYQSRGLFGARHFDTYVWMLPIPTFDADNDLHARLAELSAQAEEIAAGVDVDGKGFQAARKLVRTALTDTGVTAELDAAVAELLGLDAA